MAGGKVRTLALAATALSALGALCAPARADTLQEALTAAYRNNPTLAAARATQRATDENVPIQKAAGRPQVTTTSQYVEFVKSSSVSFIAPERAVTGQLNLTVPVYSGGAVRNGVHAAEARVDAGLAGLRATESSIFSQTVASYMDVLRTQAIVGLQANQVEVLAVNLRATRDRFEIGELTRTDVAQSQSRLALARSDFRTAQANLIAARETYAQLTGMAAGDLRPPPPLPDFPAEVDDAADVALAQNPDIIAAKDRARAAGFDVGVAGAGRLPRVSVTSGSSYNNYLGTLQAAGRAFPQASTAVQVGVQLNLPLFQGGLPAAQRRQAQAREGAALEQVIAAERAVVAQVRAAWSSWQAATAVIQSAQAAIEAATLSLEGVRAENSIGNRTILEALNAEQELLNARVALVTARRNAYVAGFTLLAAMGRAEARDLGLMDEGLLYDPVANYARVKGKWLDWGDDPAPVVTTTSTAGVLPATAAVPADAIPQMGETGNKPGY